MHVDVVREQPVPPPIQTVVVTLSEEEARHLLMLMGRVADATAEGAHLFANNLYWKLAGALHTKK